DRLIQHERHIYISHAGSRRVCFRQTSASRRFSRSVDSSTSFTSDPAGTIGTSGTGASRVFWQVCWLGSNTETSDPSTRWSFSVPFWIDSEVEKPFRYLRPSACIPTALAHPEL